MRTLRLLIGTWRGDAINWSDGTIETHPHEEIPLSYLQRIRVTLWALNPFKAHA